MFVLNKIRGCDDLNIQKLIYFNYAASYLNFSKAAEACNIAQTAMSRCIAQLENELGCALFNRTNRKITLTPAGKRFWEETRVIVDKYERARKVARDAAMGFNGFISIGYGGFDRLFAIEYAESFRAEHPDVKISLFHYPYDDLAHSLITENCDIIFGPANRLLQLNNVRTVTTYVSKYYLAVSEKHPFAEREEITGNVIKNETILFPAKAGFLERTSNYRFCLQFDIMPGEIVYSNCPEAMLAMIELNLGISLVPEQLFLDDLKRIKLIPIKPQPQGGKEHMAASFLSNEKAVVSSFLNHIEKKRPEITEKIQSKINAYL